MLPFKVLPVVEFRQGHHCALENTIWKEYSGINITNFNLAGI